ncbi:MAG: thioredoxin domain-containing protein [bacterium]
MEEEKKEIQDASIEVEVDETETEFEGEEVQETEEEKKDKKIKNLISAVILLSGLFVGSLFVDAIQMAKGGGFSQHALDTSDVFASGGKTWVAYPDPLVKVQVISDDTCEACKPDEVLIGLKQALPTISNEKIDANSLQGQKLITKFNIKTIPAFIFSKEIEKTDLFAKAEPFLDKQGDFYAIKSAEAGFPVGKYISAPRIADNDIIIGSKDADVKIVLFSNFQNPTDKKNYETIVSPMLKEYGDKVEVAFKNYVPASATQAISAALASLCANEQGKFLPYADKLFATQDAWGKAKDATSLLKGYAATTGLNAGDFNKCLDEKRYKDLLTQSLADGQSFGVASTPSIFVGNDLQPAAAKYDDIKSTIDKKLTK